MSTQSLEETITITGMQAKNDGTPSTIRLTTGSAEFDAVVRTDSPAEAAYYRHGGILPYVLRQLLDQETPS